MCCWVKIVFHSSSIILATEFTMNGWIRNRYFSLPYLDLLSQNTYLYFLRQYRYNPHRIHISIDLRVPWNDAGHTFDSSTFLDFRSRCITRAECRKAIPRATSMAMLLPLPYQPSMPSASLKSPCRRSPPCAQNSALMLPAKRILADEVM